MQGYKDGGSISGVCWRSSGPRRCYRLCAGAKTITCSFLERCLFGAAGGAYSAWSYATTAMHLRINVAEGRPLPHWTLHDLRRTFRTGLGRLGVQPHVAERCMGHVQGGVERIYDRHKYQDEIKFALAQCHVTKIVR